MTFRAELNLANLAVLIVIKLVWNLLQCEKVVFVKRVVFIKGDHEVIL